MGAAFLTFFDRALLAPLLTAIADGLDASVDDVGHALTVYVVAYAAAQLLWSAVSSRLGQLRVLRVSLPLAVVGCLVSAAAPDVLVLGIARAVSGAAVGATVPAVLVFLGDTVPIARRGVAMANLATALSLGMAVGTAAAALAGPAGAWRGVFLGSAVAAAVILVLVWRLDPGPRPADPVPVLRAIPRVLGDRWALVTLALAVLEGILLVGAINFLPVALESAGAPAALAGLVTSLFGLAVIASSQLVKRIVVRAAPFVLLLAGGVATVVGYALLAAVVTVPTVLVASVLFGFAWASAHTQLQTWMTDVLVANRPVGMALFATALFGGGSIGAALGTAATSADAYPALFLGSTALAVVFTLGATLGRARYLTRET